MPPTTVMPLGDSPVWLLDRVDGTLQCHAAIAVSRLPDGSVRELPVPGDRDPTDMCALSALTAVTIGGQPALWIEQSGAYSNRLAQSTVTITPVSGDGFGPSCDLTVDYTLTGTATHAFCDGIDCVPLVRTAEILAMRLRNEEAAETLGAGVIRSDNAPDYRRMAELAAEDKEPTEFPSFGVTLDTPYTVFAEPVTFPLRLDDGRIYLARLGHGGFGWRESPDVLLAVYRLRNGRMVPAASVFVAARRTGIAAVSVRPPD